MEALKKEQVEELHNYFEDETLAKIDLGNNLQSLQEEMSCKEQVYNQELTKTLARHQVEISEIYRRLAEQYEAKLKQSLQEKREQNAQMKANRDRITRLFQNKTKKLAGRASVVYFELQYAHASLDARNTIIGEFESASAALKIRLGDLEKTLDTERQRHAEERAALEAEVQEFRDYKEENWSEVEVWRYMKRSKETPRQGIKRRHVMLEESQKSSIMNSIFFEKWELMGCELKKMREALTQCNNILS